MRDQSVYVRRYDQQTVVDEEEMKSEATVVFRTLTWQNLGCVKVCWQEETPPAAIRSCRSQSRRRSYAISTCGAACGVAG